MWITTYKKLGGGDIEASRTRSLLRSWCFSLSLSVRSERFRLDEDELLAGDGLIERDARREYSRDFRPPDVDVCLADDGGECWSTATGGDRDRERGDFSGDRLLER